MKNAAIVRGVRCFFSMQLLTSILMALAFSLVFGKKEAISALLAGIVAIIPAVVFALKFFHTQGARAAKQIIKNFYFGEALKIWLSVTLFALVFFIAHVNGLVFFLTYITVLITQWFAPLFFNNLK